MPSGFGLELDEFNPNVAQVSAFESGLIPVLQGLRTQAAQEQIKSEQPINAGEIIVSSLPTITSSQDVIDNVEFALDRQIKPEEIDVVSNVIREGTTQGMTPSEIANIATQTIGQREVTQRTKEERKSYEDLLREQTQKYENVFSMLVTQSRIA